MTEIQFLSLLVAVMGVVAALIGISSSLRAVAAAITYLANKQWQAHTEDIDQAIVRK